MEIIIDNATRRIVAWGDALTPPTDTAFAHFSVSDALMNKIHAAGPRAALTADGTDITLLSADPTLPPVNAKRVAAIAALKTVASGAGPQAAVAQAILDLHGIA